MLCLLCLNYISCHPARGQTSDIVHVTNLLVLKTLNSHIMFSPFVHSISFQVYTGLGLPSAQLWSDPPFGSGAPQAVKIGVMPSCSQRKSSSVAWSLTHWGRDKMDAILQTTFSSAFSWMKMFEFRLKFHLSLFPRVQLTIFQHCFR